MKTRRYITGMLILLVFGLVSIQAQSARQAATPSRNERAAATKTTASKATTVKKANTPKEATTARVQKQPVQSQSSAVTRATTRNAATPKVQDPPAQRQSNAVTRATTRNAATPKVQDPPAQRQSNAATRTTTRNAATPKVQDPPAQRQSNAATRTNRNVAAPAVQNPPAQRQRTSTPASISTPNNPRSNYGQPVSNVATREIRNLPARRTEYSTKTYYGGNQYHYVYPTTRVNIHIHQDTYLHNYNVLYYPSYGGIFWTRRMYRDYVRWYPGYTWRYSWGYRINSLSIFEARFYLGEVAMVYGRVYATWYNAETDDYLLFFGGDYPNHQFTVVLPGRIARRFSWRPERYFLGEHITVTGLITTFDGVPEIIVKNKHQLGLY